MGMSGSVSFQTKKHHWGRPTPRTAPIFWAVHIYRAGKAKGMVVKEDAAKVLMNTTT
jgi:hypothetical protein